MFVITDLIGQKYHDEPVMTTEMLTSLKSSGWEIGSHTRTHPNLTELPDFQVNAELRISKKRLEEILNTNIVSLAYPYGAYNNRIKSIAAKDYTLARTVSCYPPVRLNNLIPRDRLELKAMSTYEHPTFLPLHIISNHLVTKIGHRKQKKNPEHRIINTSRKALEARFIRKWIRNLRKDQWLILCFHNLTTRSQTSYSINIKEFREIAKAIGQDADVTNLGDTVRL